MKIFSSSQIKACDAFTIQKEGITSAALMERAADACYQWISTHYAIDKPLLVVCGMGNNGGDGLALTRILLQNGFSAKAVILKSGAQFSADASHHLALLHHLAPDNIRILEEGMFVTELADDILIVDALFGTGLNRPLEGWPAAFVKELNELPNEKIAIDIPSGLPADSLPEPGTAVIHAAHTLSFQFYKRSFLHQESARHTGRLHLLDIGLSEQFTEATHSQYQAIDFEAALKIYRPRNPSAHKGTYGKAVLIGGSYGKMGAIALSTEAALRSGAGLVFTHAPECGYNILQTLHPEAMFVPGGKKITEHITVDLEQASIGIGPGLGKAAETANALIYFIDECKKSLVLDADALNILAGHQDSLHLLPADSILTPHPREFERLFGKTNNSMLQTELARAKAMKHNIFIILKGHHTAVITPSGECWYNTTGNAGMATGGSGDVLTGILTSLLAQGYPSKEAALLGVYLHGMAGDIAAAELSEEALIAGDIPAYLGKAFLKLRNATS